MVYECEVCEATLAPGVLVCPRCGERFDTPVPPDAVTEDTAAEEAAPAVSRRRGGPLLTVAGTALLLPALAWLGLRHVSFHAAPRPAPAAFAALPTDLAAHPRYAPRMKALVQILRAAGMTTQWPAFGSSDILLVTPSAESAKAGLHWDKDLDRRLAQGVYGQFAMTRFEAGFPEADTTACFVLVTDEAGTVVAGDFMGQLK